MWWTNPETVSKVPDIPCSTSPIVQIHFRPEITCCNTDISRIFSRRCLLQNLHMWRSLQYKKSGNCCPLGTEQHITFKSFHQAPQPTGDCDGSRFVGCSTSVFGEMFPNFRRPIYLPSNDLTPGLCVMLRKTSIWILHNSLRRGLSQITSHKGPKNWKTNLSHLPNKVVTVYGWEVSTIPLQFQPLAKWFQSPQINGEEVGQFCSISLWGY
jgi:hypothetical protein